MKNFALRLPDNLHAKLKRLADKEHRSIHAQIIYILERYLKELQN